MSERVEMWKTDDGKLWATAEKAAKHEKRFAALARLEKVWYSRCIECKQDFINFLDDNSDIAMAIIAAKE